MADRGRDLKVSILSDADRFDVDQPARDLERLADAADDTGRRLGDLDGKVEGTGRTIRNLERDTRDGEQAVQRFGTEAKDTAAKVDDAFDKIARSSRAAARKVDDDMDRVGDSFDDAKGEIGGTAREAAASFSGGMDDIADAGQEAAVNVAAAFGPAGIVAGVVAAGGIAMLRADAEKLKETVEEMTEAMIETGGALDEAFIDNKLQEMARDGTLTQLQEQAANLNINFEDLARAMAGDAEAAERVMSRVGELSEALTDQAAKAGTATGEMYAQQTALGELAGKLNDTVTANRLAERATSAYAKAAKGAGADTRRSAHVTGAAWDDLRANLGKPITAKVAVQAPSAAEIDAVNRAIRRGIGTIVVPVKAGQSRYENTADNSRYRQ